MAKALVALSHVSDGSMYNRDDAFDAEIIANRQAWFNKHGIALKDATRLYITYLNGDETFVKYRVVSEGEKGAGMTADDIENADALVTTTPGHALFLPVSDCVATTLFDEERGVLMLTHLGRQSLEQNGGLRSVQFLIDTYQTNPENLKVWLSASISKKLYGIYKLDNKGMKEVVHEQLAEAGILPSNIVDDTSDTGTDDEYYSYSESLKGNKKSDGSHAMVAVIQS